MLLNKRKKSGLKFNTPSTAGCFKCRDTGKMLKECPKLLNIALAAVQKIKYLSSKKSSNSFHLVLDDLCKQLDGCSNFTSKDDEEDVEIV